MDFEKGVFNGRQALLEEKQNGSRYRLVKLDIDGNKPAKDSYVFVKGKNKVAGTVTSAMWSPAVKSNIALAMIRTAHLDGDIWVEIYYQKELRQYRKMALGTIQKKPFWAPPRARATPPISGETTVTLERSLK